MIKQRPLADRIIIKPDVFEQPEGLYVSDEKPPPIGTVVAIGRGKLGYNDLPIPVEPKVGDRVQYGNYSGQKIEIDGEDYLIMKESEILMIL